MFERLTYHSPADGSASSRTIMIAIVSCSLVMSSIVQAAEIKVLASTAVQEILLELTPRFEKESGDKIAVTWSGTENIKNRVGGGEPFDLVIVGATVIDAFIKDGKVAIGSRVDLVNSGVGVAVKAGAPRPDISSGEAVKKSLLAAKVVAYSTGPSGVYIQRMFENMGIADQMKVKSKQTVSGTRVGQYLAKGEADLGFQQESELIHEQGIDFLGPLPAEVQNITIFSSGILTGSNASESAKALQKFLTAPAAFPVIRKNGMEPNHP